MRAVINHYILCIATVVCAFSGVQMVSGQTPYPDSDIAIEKAFRKQVDEYVALRNRLESTLPALSTKATPEEIDAHELKLRILVQNARAEFKRGSIFDSRTAAYFLRLIKQNYPRKKRAELKTAALTADTNEVLLKVNFPYPDDQELLEMPPKLLLALPELPSELRYRFVRKALLIVDRENRVIVDFMPDAIP